MNPIFDAAAEMQQFCRRRGWRFCIIGGLAAIRWGQPRGTEDVDISLFTGLGGESQYIAEVLAHFSARIGDAAEFALRHRVLLIAAANGVPIDVGLAGTGYEESLMRRATPFEFCPGLWLTTCSAEDLIVMKAFADRPSDWLAIEGVIVRQSGRLDWDCILGQLVPLCELKEAPEIPVRLARLRQRLEAG